MSSWKWQSLPPTTAATGEILSHQLVLQDQAAVGSSTGVAYQPSMCTQSPSLLSLIRMVLVIQIFIYVCAMVNNKVNTHQLRLPEQNEFKNCGPKVPSAHILLPALGSVTSCAFLFFLSWTFEDCFFICSRSTHTLFQNFTVGASALCDTLFWQCETRRGESYPYGLHTSYPSKICRNNMP